MSFRSRAPVGLSRRVSIRAAVTIPAVLLIAALVGGAGAGSRRAVTISSSAAAPASATVKTRPASATVKARPLPPRVNKVAIPDFDPATWKPTAELPLPPLQSPITFALSDAPAYWFDNALPDLEGILHTRSLAAGVGPTTIKFSIGEPHTSQNHTTTSIVWPEGAKNMPFRQQGAQTGELSVDLVTPGLYVFQCSVHPYMLGAVVIDDPATPGADLGMKVRWIDGTTMPTASDEILKIVRSFFILSEPANWQYFADKDTTWDPSYPAAPIMTGNPDGSPNFIPNLDLFYQKMFNEPVTLKAPVKPSQPGVGEVLIDTQFELSAGKTKPGSITSYDAETWEMTKKIFLPQINMNNPHNMAVTADQKILFQNEWFSNKTTAIERETGKFLYSTEVGPSPSHVMRRAGTGTLIIPNNGGNKIVELDPAGKGVIKSYLTQFPGENPAFPHAHWLSPDGRYVITPNSNETKATIFDLEAPNPSAAIRKPESGGFPVATSMTNDGKRAYSANLLDHTLRCFSLQEPACPTPEGGVVDTYVIDLRQNYDKVSGASTGPYGLSPIQLPISPDDRFLIAAGTFTANAVLIDMKTNKIVKTLPGCPGAHGINFGAKKGGGYYAYLTNKFCNKLTVIDGDPNGDGDISDATVAGELLTNGTPPVMDDTPVAQFGQGGQGVWAVPEVYNGWVQAIPEKWKALLTCKQREPMSNAPC